MIPERTIWHPFETPGYQAAFRREFAGVDTREEILLDALLPACPAGEWIADLGCGAGRWSHAIGRRRPAARLVGVDACREALEGAGFRPGECLVCGDFMRLPLGDGSCRAAVSGLLSLNYAGSAAGFRRALVEAARITAPGGPLIAELAVAWKPERLQGLGEVHGSYRFLYHDVLEEGPEGAALRAGIDLGAESSQFVLFVPRIGAMSGFLRDCGWGLRAFMAPHDADSATLAPPRDSLRAVVHAVRLPERAGA